MPNTPLPRLMRNRQEDTRDERFKIYSQEIRAEIERCKPKVVVLSAETLFGGRPADRESPLIHFLKSLGASDIQTAAYMRRPSHHFAAKSVQALRGASILKHPKSAKFRGVASFFPKLVGGSLSLLAYQPAALRSGDVVVDFISRFLPELPAGTIQSQRVNEGMSAEMMAILQAYRRTVLSHRENAIVPKATWVADMLRRLATENNLYTSARLHDPIAAYIDQGTTDLLWLRDEYKIAFDGVDYDKIGKQPTLNLPEDLSVADIFQVDRKVQDTLAALALDELIRSKPRRMIIGDAQPEVLTS